MTRLFASLLTVAFVVAATPTPSFAQVGPGGTFSIGNNDPCQNPGTAKFGAIVNISTATVTQLVAPQAGRKLYACGLRATITPGASAQFITGQGAACASSTVLVTGTFSAAVGQQISLSDSITSFTAPSTSGICLVSAGTTPSIQGIFVYALGR